MSSVLSWFEVAPPAFQMKTCYFNSDHKKKKIDLLKAPSAVFPFEVHSDESNVLRSSCAVSMISKSVPFCSRAQGASVLPHHLPLLVLPLI